MEKVETKQEVLKLKLKYVLKYVTLLVLFFVCNKASINMGYLAPFCFGLYYALMFKQKDVWGVSLTFFVAYNLSFLSLNALYVSLNLVGAAILFYWLHVLVKKQAHNLLVCLYALIGNVAYIVLNSGSGKEIVTTLITLFLGILFLYCCLHLFGLKNRNIKTKLSTDEVMCLGVIIAACAMGLSALTFYQVEMLKIVGVCIILFLSYILDAKTNLIFASLFGIGASLYYTNLTYVAAFVAFSLCAIGFKSSYKIIPCVAIILCEVIFGLYFLGYETFSVFSVVSVIIGEVVFLVLPTKLLNAVGDKVKSATENIAVRGIINRSRETLTKRMTEISNVFLEMDMVYKQMVQGVLPEPDAKQMLKQELFEKCCKDCVNKNKCTRVDGKFSTEVFNDIVNVGFEKGKITLIDLPQYLTTKCGRVNYILSTMNALLKSYKHYACMVNNMDASKILIADQLKGVSSLIKTLADEVNLNIVYDVAKENRIKEELAYKNICCLEAIVYEQSTTLKYVSLIIAEKQIDKQKLEKIVSKIVGSKLCVCESFPSSITGATEVVLKTRANYDIVFGSASQTKTGKVLSGDTHSLIKIDDGKYMVALCDGMGSGEDAHKISDLTITLIENFYKAGFENDIILNSVNKLLSINSDESFSALDICVFDLRKNIMDFIKLGSPFGFVKHKFETELIASSGLPIGVLDEMKPHITKKMFTDFDIVVLVSDGVSDAYGGGEELKTFINNLTSINPQTIADEILDHAVDLVNGNCEDDFTVVAVRVYPLN